MHESFWFGSSLGDLLISGLKVENVGSMVGACFFFFFLTILFGCLKMLESKMRKDHNTRMRKALEGACSGDRSNLLGDSRAIPGPSNRTLQPIATSPPISNKYLLKLCQVAIYTTNIFINYIIMLAVMLYNVYLFIAILIGITLGYFLFGHIKIAYNMETVTEKQQTVTICAPGCEDPDGSTPPALRNAGTVSNASPYSCETRAQMQRLLEHSPTNSSDGTQETEMDVTQEQVEVHVSRAKSLQDKVVNEDNDTGCCGKTKSSDKISIESDISCCGADKAQSTDTSDDNFKSCSEKRKNESSKDDQNG